MEKNEAVKSEEKGLKLPNIRIENKGCLTKIYVDGKELDGVRSVNFVHDREKDDLPVLRIELLAEQIAIDTAQVFALPEVYHPFYVSSDRLVELGVMTYDQLNDMLEKKML